MYRFLLFIKNIQTTLLFIALEIMAGWFFFGTNPYQKAKMINTSNVVMSGIYDGTSMVTGYFSLSSDNELLANENALLKKRLSNYESLKESVMATDSLHLVDTSLKSTYIAAKVIRNYYTKPNNYITINKGRAQGIEPEMALVNDAGIVGYVLDCSENISVALSVLNHNDFNTSGKIKNTDFPGSVTWNGVSYRTVQLTEIPKYSNIAPGDTIVTTEYSNIFPANYPIGVVRDFELINGTFYKANVDLFADMSRLTYVYAIKIPLQEERSELEDKVIK